MQFGAWGKLQFVSHFADLFPHLKRVVVLWPHLATADDVERDDWSV
jgi:hypothetical protein